jgi:hypothetical protein
MMLLAAPSLPGQGLNPACAASDALLCATVSVIGTHAAVGVIRD